jgi:hypothetical protein
MVLRSSTAAVVIVELVAAPAGLVVAVVLGEGAPSIPPTTPTASGNPSGKY